MSKLDPNDRSTYTSETLSKVRFSHGRITIEGFDKVINIKSGFVTIETNHPSKNDPEARVSIVVHGGKWSLEDKLRNPKNAACFRY